jgi:hypothetical protein
VSKLLTLLIKDGDTRRAVVSALRPILIGATTTSDVFEHRLTEADIERFDKLAAVGATKGGDAFCKSLAVVHALFKQGTGRSLGEIFEIKT